MIFIGYQGIGKSTIAQNNDHYVDLESGCFWHNGKRAIDWFISYCKIAEHLSKQGYVVFVSSHAEVRECLKSSKESVIAIVPSAKLKDQWIEKLKLRWEDSQLGKDMKAYLNAKDRYIENLREIKKDVEFIEITDMDYSLKKIIGQFER